MTRLDETQVMKTCRTGELVAGTLSSGRKIEEEEKEDEVERDEIEEGQMVEYRTILPALKPPDQKVSIWKVIKDAVGKDLSKFCVPVYFNEPISMV